MGDYFNNGVEFLLDKDSFLEKYGCIKIEYRENENQRYYIYAFENELPEWNFNKGKLLMVTQDKEIVNCLKSEIFHIEIGKFFCKECFRNKNVERFSNSKETKYWFYNFWKKTPEHTKQLLQSEILFSINDFDWWMVEGITSENPSVFLGTCSTHCMSREECENNKDILEQQEKMNMIWEKLIADAIINGTESLLEDFLCDYIETIEDGMKLIERQHKVESGFIDILAEDINGVKCVIELKIVDNDKSIIWQSSYYPTCFDEEVRMITIAPNYSNKIYRALQNVKNVEIKVFDKSNDGFLEIKEFEVEITKIEEIDNELIKDAI
ncbi:endonuclease NucS domain-containing protein [Bacillus cereus group sp. TH160LC]|uniref:endonuclease NucS domain-containing protein n=1 Tax=Bacillus cereus group sp. TH160LC TaxID=3018058 RepID=UPI0022E42A5B|nr:endonuclease NucS domain-containing protein [Bacillus cereus group sp. TH160LC]MDA1650955.1 endonuclease NucS [Bacillus cereus group sp. TH160LC]